MGIHPLAPSPPKAFPSTAFEGLIWIKNALNTALWDVTTTTTVDVRFGSSPIRLQQCIAYDSIGGGYADTLVAPRSVLEGKIRAKAHAHRAKPALSPSSEGNDRTAWGLCYSGISLPLARLHFVMKKNQFLPVFLVVAVITGSLRSWADNGDDDKKKDPVATLTKEICDPDKSNAEGLYQAKLGREVLAAYVMCSGTTSLVVTVDTKWGALPGPWPTFFLMEKMFPSCLLILQEVRPKPPPAVFHCPQ